jgi:acyl carrier protein
MKRWADIEQRVTRLLFEQMAREVSSADADLLDAGILDSMAFVDLLHHLEREFDLDVRLEDLEIDHFRSVSRIAAFVGTHGRRTSVP